jgi:transcription elongation factor GreB
VELEDEAGEELRLRIVGPDEIEPQKMHISMDSPMAKALFGKQVDDEIEVFTPQGAKRYFILSIQYL